MADRSEPETRKVDQVAKDKLDGIWERARRGDSAACDELMQFVSDNRKELAAFSKLKGRRPSRERTTEIVQWVALGLCEKIRRAKLGKPKKNAWETLKACFTRKWREFRRFLRGAPRGHAKPGPFAEDAEDQWVDRTVLDPARDIPELEERFVQLQRLEAALGGLPAEEQEILRMRRQGLSEKDIAERLGQSYDAVRQRCHRAIERLADLMARRRIA